MDFGPDNIPAALERRINSLPFSDALVDDPSVDGEMYARVTRHICGEIANTKHLIYLDQNYWNYCRDAAANQPQKPIHRDIWKRLKRLALEGRICCPLHDSIYSETLKLKLRSGLRVARVQNRLSQGVALQPHLELMRFELSHWVWTALIGNKTLKSRKEYAYLPIGYILGELHPNPVDVDPLTKSRIQKGLFRFLSHTRPTELFWMMADSFEKEKSDLIQRVSQNFLSDFYQHQWKDFKELLDIEFDGMAQTIAETQSSFAAGLIASGADFRLGEEQNANPAIDLAAWVASALKNGHVSTHLPTLHITATLHAIVRSVKPTRYQPGDMFDFHHAAAALGYCNAFFTERRLTNLLHHHTVPLAKLYECEVLYDAERINDYLKRLAL